jgi:MSHA pilin protein MshA
MMTSQGSEGKDTMNSSSPGRSGFTLIELMAVVLILGILAGVALPRFLDYGNQAREAACKGALGGVRAGVANYYANEAVINGTALYPDRDQLTDGSTMQEELPQNPYNSSNAVVTATSLQAAARTAPLAGGAGWAYYDGSGGGDAVFYANTSNVGENTF